MTLRAPAIFSLLAASISLAGCFRGAVIDYDTAMKLIREHGTDSVRITFSASPRFTDDSDTLKMAYDRLIETHVLDCKPHPVLGTLCRPGEAGQEIQETGQSELTMVAGAWVPAVITDIARSGTDQAVANVRFSFEPSTLFREFRYSFEKFQDKPGSQLSLSSEKSGRSARATFQKYPDGWHLDSLDPL